MLDTFSDEAIVALIGLMGGVLLGLAARIGRFCTLGAIEDALYSSSDLRLRMWGVAIGVAILGTFGLIGTGLLTPAETFYLQMGFAPLAHIPVAHVIGGLVFGYGMALSGNCGYGALARLGGGDLRSFVIVLVMGLAAYATLSGPLAYLRVWLFPPQPAPDTLPSFAVTLTDLLGLSPVAGGMAIGVAVLILAVAPRHARSHIPTLFWGSIVGLAIITGWAGTQWVADTGFSAVPVQSHTFSAPVGEAMLYAMTGSGRSLSFGVGSVAGVCLGAFLGSLIKGQFRWEACEDPRELRRQIVGASIMGVGAVVAVGCSVGQGLSAMSVLSFGAPLTLLSIFIGAAVGLRQLITGLVPAD